MKFGSFLKLLLCFSVLTGMALVDFRLPNVLANSSVTVNWNDTKQKIDGFGASSAWIAGAIQAYPITTRTQLLDALFSPTNGAGLSIIRNRIPPEIETSKGNWNWTTDNATVWLTNEGKNRGVSKVWATPWSPPAWMKSNNNVNNGGYLNTANFQDYADYLSRYVREYKSRFGIDNYAISIQNEPDLATDYESSQWYGSMIRDFVKNNLTPTFQSDGVTAKVIPTEPSGWTENFAYDTLMDTSAVNGVHIVGAHHYSGTLSPMLTAQSKGKDVWLTEVGILGDNVNNITDGLRWGQEVHDTLVTAEANAFHYWWLYTDWNNGGALINGDAEHTTFTANKRLWTIGNFSRFVRPGYNRIGLSSNNPESNVYTSAYKDSVTGKLVIVAINKNNSLTSVTFNLNGTSLSSTAVTPYRTSSSENLTQLTNLTASGGSFTATLAASSVTTFVASTGSASTFNPNAYYKIINRNSGKAMDAAGTANGSNVQQYAYWGGDNQLWKIEDVGGGYYKFTGKQSGRVVDISGKSTADGGNVIIYSSNGGTNQQFSITSIAGGYYQILNRNSGKAVEVAGSSTSDGGNVQQYIYSGGNNQQWSIVQVQ